MTAPHAPLEAPSDGHVPSPLRKGDLHGSGPGEPPPTPAFDPAPTGAKSSPELAGGGLSALTSIATVA